ncbi:MAG: DUF488 domain-containing protein [Bdellovibrionales bacterium]|nr:DUF488 domain-containing protein [Bdellovibrionales bacterium]
MENIIFTIGHSTHKGADFIKLLKRYNISLVCDVRSQPYSKYNNQFNRENIKKVLIENKVDYLFLGEELGARSKNKSFYDKGKLQYQLLAQSYLFKKGLEKLIIKVEKERVVLMCSESDPLNCHRTILICRELYKRRAFSKNHIQHILSDGFLNSHTEIEKQLLKKFKLEQPDMFRSEESLIEEAYHQQEKKIAYTDEKLLSVLEVPQERDSSSYEENL